MDSTEKYVFVSLSEENWRQLLSILDSEFTNTAKVLSLAKEQDNLHLCKSYYIDKINLLSVCMDEIMISLNYGNKDK